MKVRALKRFPYYPDGITRKMIEIDQDIDLPDTVALSLESEGYVEAVDAVTRVTGDPPPPSVQSPEPPPPPEDPPFQEEPVDIPTDWQSMHHMARIALARKLAPAEQIDHAAEADAAIAAELARRAGQ